MSELKLWVSGYLDYGYLCTKVFQDMLVGYTGGDGDECLSSQRLLFTKSRILMIYFNNTALQTDPFVTINDDFL